MGCWAESEVASYRKMGDRELEAGVDQWNFTNIGALWGLASHPVASWKCRGNTARSPMVARIPPSGVACGWPG